MAHILVVDDELSMREFLEILLGKNGHDVVVAPDAERALALFDADVFDLVITDLNLGGRVTGLHVLEQAKKRRPDTEVLVITAFATKETAIQAMKAGAHGYLTKPFKVDELVVVVNKALEKRALVLERSLLRDTLAGRTFDAMVGKSAAMKQVYALVEKVAPTKTTVLISGESGTGKELVARSIHTRSPRANAPFVPVNCGAIPDTLIESELFGHTRGAFTDAREAQPGLFGAADGGTLFLDEIGELPLQTQVALLRAIQEKRVRPIGSAKDLEVDVRIVAATNRDLAAEVKAGRFREDLFYRLDVVRIHVPPLRARREDVILLAQHFLARYCAELGRAPMHLSGAARQRLDAYAFPGNVRELENLVERTVTLADGLEIGADALPGPLRQATPPLEEIGEGFDLQERLDAIERSYLLSALDRARGVKKDAAALLGLTFRQYRHRLKKLGGTLAEGDDEGEGEGDGGGEA